MAVLIVEDNPTNAMIIKHLAKKVTSKEIKVAGDGNTALMLCHTESFEILIVDYQLPGMSGLQFVKAVRLMDRYCDTPVVMVTADDQPRLCEEAKAAGVTDFLRKPVEAVAFRKLLADHLGAEAVHPELRSA
ncbi:MULTISPECIES: response regulator [Rhizobiaceae]|jgi:CheY-like chemotaxis protein|uniref:Response regulator n=1 Tax=Peteryoungia algae TaxID=2919917 RepID=A0ABT0CW22_9HYPH|nr:MULTISPECIES: response regulator [unclassified Rhizobium]MCC8931606.1 response regulator [Rhizobium sp. 'Codium 1']MCJ8237149.1 response regulator [Rhizobium sp. SSM4.3]